MYDSAGTPLPAQRSSSPSMLWEGCPRGPGPLYTCRESAPSSHRSSRPTLGQLLHLARQRQRRSLRDVAAAVTKMDGAQISPQYLGDLEKDRRQPTPHVLRELARTLGLTAETLAAAQGAESVLRLYLQAHHDQEAAVIAFFRLATTVRFQEWERLHHILLCDDKV